MAAKITRPNSFRLLTANRGALARKGFAALERYS
jgi:hypothetical protein